MRPEVSRTRCLSSTKTDFAALAFIMNNKTILISGAGIAGPTLAFWLKAAGFEPTLIERAPALRTGGYVIDFWGLDTTSPSVWVC